MAWNDFERIDESMEAGAAAARSALPQIKTLLAPTSDQSSEPGLQAENLMTEALPR